MCFVVIFEGAKKSKFYVKVKLSVLHANRRIGIQAKSSNSLLKGIVNPP